MVEWHRHTHISNGWWQKSMLHNIEKQTNQYSLQKDGKEINTTKIKIEISIGIFIRMGHVKMPQVRAYRKSSTRFAPIAITCRDIHLKSWLFTDNLSASVDKKEDKLWKLRSWLESQIP